MSKKAILSLFLAVIMLFAAVTPSLAAAQAGSAQTGAVAAAAADDGSDGNAVIKFIRDIFARIKAFLAKIFPCLNHEETFPTEDVQAKYGGAVASLSDYADYGFEDVKETPLAGLSFDDITSLNKLPGGAMLSDVTGAELITGRFGLRKAVEFVKPETYLTLPDIGRQDALTISMWVNVHDLTTRENMDEPRVSTLLDTETGSGRVTLKFVHTGTPSYVDEATGETVMGTNATRLVFSVEGNSGGEFEGSGVNTNNTQYFNFEYDLWKDFIGRDQLIMPLDAHVLKQARKLKLLAKEPATMATARKLTAIMAGVFPGDPLRGDFALFGQGRSGGN